jgi:hypothetical protein
MTVMLPSRSSRVARRVSRSQATNRPWRSRVRPLARLVGLLEYRCALTRLVFHAAAVMNVAVEEITAFLPPNRPFRGPERTPCARSQLLNRLRGRDDAFQLRGILVDPLARLGGSPAKGAPHCKAACRGRHRQHAPPRNAILNLHDELASVWVRYCYARQLVSSESTPVGLLPRKGSPLGAGTSPCWATSVVSCQVHSVEGAAYWPKSATIGVVSSAGIHAAKTGLR